MVDTAVFNYSVFDELVFDTLYTEPEIVTPDCSADKIIGIVSWQTKEVLESCSGSMVISL